MARFDLYQTKSVRLPYLLDVQADFLSELESRVVVPIIQQAGREAPPMPRLHPTVLVSGETHILMTSEITTIPRAKLRNRVGSLANHRDEITAALDFLFQGF